MIKCTLRLLVDGGGTLGGGGGSNPIVVTPAVLCGPLRLLGACITFLNGLIFLSDDNLWRIFPLTERLDWDSESDSFRSSDCNKL